MLLLMVLMPFTKKKKKIPIEFPKLDPRWDAFLRNR